MKFASAPLLVTFHPTTLEYAATATQVQALMAALAAVDRPILFTYPNADTAASAIIAAIDDFVARRANAGVIKSLGTADYFGMMAIGAAMVGNSSSGIVEAPSFKLPAVNIGNRQRGRLRAANVIDCAPERDAILAAIERAVSTDFRASLKELANPYGDGHAAERIVGMLRGSAPRRRLGEKIILRSPVPPLIRIGGDDSSDSFHRMCGTKLRLLDRIMALPDVAVAGVVSARDHSQSTRISGLSNRLLGVSAARSCYWNATIRAG